MKKILLIYAKEPKSGFVKTRLAKDIGEESASSLYEAFLKDIVNNVSNDEEYDSKALCTPESDIGAVKALINIDNVEHQKGDGLSERLGGAFLDAFSTGYDNVIAIGTDAPLINREIIHVAFNALEESDCVIGPACDGGYYLIGLRRDDTKKPTLLIGVGATGRSPLQKKINKNHARSLKIFSGISWSTDKVFSQTVDILKRERLSYSIMKEMIDVDDLKSYNDFILQYENLTSAEKRRTINLYYFLKGNFFERK